MSIQPTPRFAMVHLGGRLVAAALVVSCAVVANGGAIAAMPAQAKEAKGPEGVHGLNDPSGSRPIDPDKPHWVAQPTLVHRPPRGKQTTDSEPSAR